MTNRGYLRGLSNEKLAELLRGSKKICHCMNETCNDYDDCEKCIKEWLDAKRETSVKKGQIRKMDYEDGYFYHYDASNPPLSPLVRR